MRRLVVGNDAVEVEDNGSDHGATLADLPCANKRQQLVRLVGLEYSRAGMRGLTADPRSDVPMNAPYD
jgi:hypothetical protein